MTSRSTTLRFPIKKLKGESQLEVEPHSQCSWRSQNENDGWENESTTPTPTPTLSDSQSALVCLIGQKNILLRAPLLASTVQSGRDGSVGSPHRTYNGCMQARVTVVLPTECRALRLHPLHPSQEATRSFAGGRFLPTEGSV